MMWTLLLAEKSLANIGSQPPAGPRRGVARWSQRPWRRSRGAEVAGIEGDGLAAGGGGGARPQCPTTRGR